MKYDKMKTIINQAILKPVGVTTILAESKPKSDIVRLEKWKAQEIKKRGLAGFKKYQEALLTTGTKVHSEIEAALLENRELNSDYSKHVQSIVSAGHWRL